MSAEAVLLERGEITTLTLNRPHVGNLVDDDSLERLAWALREVGKDEACRVLVVTGAGEQFCLGRDARGAGHGARPTAYARRASLGRIVAVNEALHALGAITIAAVNGDALGFGCGLAVQCDFTLAAQRATFGFPEIDAGLPPTIVMSYLGRYVLKKRVTELVLTGQRLSAAEAAAAGLVTRVVADDGLEREVQGLVEVLLAKDPVALHTAKQFLADTEDLTVEQAGRYGVNLLSVVLSKE